MNNQGTAGIFPRPWLGEATPPSRRWTPLLLALLVGAALGSGLTALSNARIGGASPEPAVVAREWPRRELPLEWRWAPRPVRTEHMFRKGAGAPARSMFRRP
jgi:hypothetical protein